MLEQGADQRTVLVEARRRADDRHDAVGMGELEEAVDRLNRSATPQPPQRLLRLELVGELGRATRVSYADRNPASS